MNVLLGNDLVAIPTHIFFDTATVNAHSSLLPGCIFLV